MREYNVEQSRPPMPNADGPFKGEQGKRLRDEILQFVKTKVFGVTERLAEDITQETLLKAARALRRGAYEGRSALETWIKRIALNEIRGMARHEGKKHRSQALSLDTSSGGTPLDFESHFELADKLLESRDQKRIVDEAIAKLSEPLREVVRAKMEIGEELGDQAIAEKLGIPVATVRTRLFHAKKKLRELVEEKEE